MTTHPFPPSSPEPDTSTPPHPLNARDSECVDYAMVDLASLTALLARAAGLSAVMLVCDPDQVVPVLAAATVDDIPVPVVSVGDSVLCGDLDSRAGRAAAGALAHTLVCQQQIPTRRERWIAGLTTLAFLTVLAALLLGSTLTLILGLVGWVASIASGLAAQRRREIAADLTAVLLLDSVGWDGRTCVLAMLDDIAAHEPHLFQWFGWAMSGVPTAAARARVLRRTFPTT